MSTKNVGIAVLFFIFLVVVSVAGGFAASAGASAAGMSRSQWSMEPLMYLICGFIGGGVLFPILFFSLRERCGKELYETMCVCLIIIISMAFMGGVTGYRYSVIDARANSEKYRKRTSEEVSRYHDYHQKLKEKPGIVLSEGWYRNSGPDGFLKWRVYRDSLKNPYVPYTPEIIAQLLNHERGNSNLFQMILVHSKLDSQTLEREYQLAFNEAARDKEKAGWRLIQILSVPQAKREWLLEVSSSGIADKHGILCKDRLRTIISADKRFSISPK